MKIKPVISLYQHQSDYVLNSHPHPALIAGYGSGKTFANIQRVLHLIDKRNRQNITPFIFYGAPTYDILNSTFYPEFIETLELYKIRYREQRQDRIIEITDKKIKGKVKYLSLENFKYLVGFNATDGILDEFDVLPHSRQPQIWRKALARLRGCENATLSITSTPEGHKYCYQLQSEGKIKQITASTSQNLSLPKSYLLDLLDNYDEQHVDMYVHGNYVNLAGARALYQFKRDNLIEPVSYDVLPRELTVGIDFNVDPFCMTVSAYINNQKTTFDNFYIRNLGDAGSYESYTDKAMHILLQKYPNEYYNLNHQKEKDKKTFNIKIRPDMTGGARKTAASQTDLSIIKKFNLTIEGTSNPIVTERLKVANLAMAKGKWVITKNCGELIKDCEMVITDQYGQMDKSDKLRTHSLDAVTYDVFGDFKHLIVRPSSIISRGI